MSQQPNATPVVEQTEQPE
jgi:hypothetical protein